MKKVIALCIMFCLLNGLAIAKDEALTYPDGSEYVGQVKNGKANGKGTLTWPDGRKYTGQWENGNRHGKGTMTVPNGPKYVGEFKDDHVHGKGILYNPDGSVHTKGTFQDGKYIGE